MEFIMDLVPKTCFFTGHRIIAGSERNMIKSLVNEEILNKINDKVEIFISGGARGFDTIAAEQVIFMRKDYDSIRLCLYLPCRNHDLKWKLSERYRLQKIMEQADEIYYVTDGEYEEGCMKKRNIAMVEASDCGIAYMKNRMSGSAQTIKFADEKGINVINIADKKY